MTVEITKLDNGIHVLSHHMPQLETVALGTWVRAGARDEREDQNGIAHLLEHMAFKGTSRRDALQIVEEIEAAGGEINASTSMENTGYYARVLADDWPLAVDILTDILTDPIFEEDELEREKDVVLQEIAAANDTPDDLVFDLAQLKSYPDHALGRPILGPPEKVEAYSVAEISSYRENNYAGCRMVVSAAGKIEHDAFVREVTARTQKIKAGTAADWSAAEFAGGETRVKRSLDQTHVVLNFPAIGYRDEDIYAMQVFSNILGGGMSSRLFQEVREKRGLCYAVFAYAAPFSDCGVMSFYAATAPQKSRELMDVASDVMLGLTEKVSEAEVARGKAQIKAALVMNLESAGGRADQIARQFLAFGKVPEISEITEKVEQVDADAVRAIAKRVFSCPNPAMSAVGDLKGLASYDHIAAKFA